MQHPFAALEPEYANLLARMHITRQSEATIIAGKLLQFVKEGKYAEVADKLGIPQLFIATSFEREAASNFRLSPAQGDPWNEVSRHVPKGLGPYQSWSTSALAAYTLERLDKIGRENWTWTRLCYEGELFNGFGYRAHGVHTPYDWSGTNNYARGKFTGDHRFDLSVADQQLGIIPVARIMASTMPEIDLPGWPAQVGTPPPMAQPAPIGVGGGKHDTAWLQAALNDILKLDPPLAVDGSYGRRTKAAIFEFQQMAKLTIDGLAGPVTIAALEKGLGHDD